jgi:hypothetical protein
MTSHRRRTLATIPAALCLALCAAAPALAAPIGDSKADYPTAAPAPKVGDTPADFGQPVAPASKVGDTPVDHPGASRAQQYDPPTTITVNRPERTIVREVDQLVPILLSSTAVLLALAGLGTALTRIRPIHLGRGG